MSALLLKSMVLYEIVTFMTNKEQITLQKVSSTFYQKIIPNVQYFTPLERPKRIIINRKQNKLVFFYPSPFGGQHKFTKEDELPFEKVPSRGIIEVDFGRIIIFPQEKKCSEMKETYLLETLDCNESGDGLVTKKESMTIKRVGCIFVRVWNCLIYAIGGTAQGDCERFDVNLNKWATVAKHPKPSTLISFQGVNIQEKYIYLVGYQLESKLDIWRLDIAKQESDIANPPNLTQQALSQWELMNCQLNSYNPIEMCIPFPERDEIIILQKSQIQSKLRWIKNIDAEPKFDETINLGTQITPQCSTQYSLFKGKLFIPLASGNEVLEIDLQKRFLQIPDLSLITDQRSKKGKLKGTEVNVASSGNNKHDYSKQQCATF